MPKRDPSATSPLTAREAATQVAGLLTEVAETPRQEVSPAPEDAAPPAAPVETPPAPSPVEPAATEPPPDETPTYEVTVDGETLHVDLDELRAGYSKHEDYKRKTMALAEERKAHESEAQAVQAERAQYREGLQQIVEALEQLQGEPDWAKLRAEVPVEEFLKQKADWEVSKAQTEKLKAEHKRVAEIAAEEQRQQYLKRLHAEEDKLRTLIPEWADLEKGRAEITALKGFAKSKYGFTDADIAAGFGSAAVVLLMRDAKKYQDLQRAPDARTQAKTPAIRTAKPGATPPAPPADAQKTKYLEQAAKTGRVRDAVKAVEALLEG